MIDQNEQFPEGTDSIVAGASVTTEPQEQVMVDDPFPSEGSTPPSEGYPTASESSPTASKTEQVVAKARAGGSKLADQAADKTRGLVGQGLERSSEALASVSKLVGDTAAGLDDRLGTEYGDYARRAAGAIEGAANSLASKSPDQLIDDTRDFVKKSPGIALAGAAVIGFVLTRLVKTGLDSDKPKA